MPFIKFVFCSLFVLAGNCSPIDPTSGGDGCCFNEVVTFPGDVDIKTFVGISGVVRLVGSGGVKDFATFVVSLSLLSCPLAVSLSDGAGHIELEVLHFRSGEYDREALQHFAEIAV